MNTELTVAYTSLDVLKYLARRIRWTVDWTTDGLAGKQLYGEDHPEIKAVWDMAGEIEALLGPLHESWDRYSDGRPVVTSADIEPGHSYRHIWHPDPEKNRHQVLRGKRIADPGCDNGGYEITVIPPDTLMVQMTPPGGGAR